MKNGGDNTEKSQDGIVSGGSSRLGLPFFRNKRNIIFLICLIVAALLVIAGWLIYQQQAPTAEKGYDKDSTEYQTLLNAQAEPLPADELGKARHYGHIAQAYVDLKDYDKALEAALKADGYLTKEARDLGYTFNVDIANIYSKLGNKSKAREYYQSEIDRLKSGEFAEDNAEVIQNIEKLKRDV